MGLFVLADKPEADMTILDFVEVAEANIRLWKENQSSVHILRAFAIPYLSKAAELLDESNHKEKS